MMANDIVMRTTISETSGILHELILVINGLLFEETSFSESPKTALKSVLGIPLRTSVYDRKRHVTQTSQTATSIGGKSLKTLPVEIIENQKYMEVRKLALLYKASITHHGDDEVYLFMDKKIVNLQNVEKFGTRYYISLEDETVLKKLGITYNPKTDRLIMPQSL